MGGTGTFSDLDWKRIIRKSAVVVLAYLALLFVLSRLAPESFGLQTREEWSVTLGYALAFFLVFVVVFSIMEIRRRGRDAPYVGSLTRGGPLLWVVGAVAALIVVIVAVAGVAAVAGGGGQGSSYADMENAEALELAFSYEDPDGEIVEEARVSGREAILVIAPDVADSEAAYVCDYALEVSYVLYDEGAWDTGETSFGGGGLLDASVRRGGDFFETASCSW